MLHDDDYRSILSDLAGVDSSRDLDGDGFEAVMFRFHQLGFKSTWNRANFGYRAGMATPRQVAFIRALWRNYTGGVGTDRSLSKWLEAKFKVSSLRFLPSETAPKVIAALRSMVAKTIATAKAG